MKAKNLSFFLIVTLLIFWGTYSVVTAQENSLASHSADRLALNADIFNYSEPAIITLKYDIREFLKGKYSDDYTDAELIFHINDTISISNSVRIRPRGNNRREVCTFPPIYINIKKSVPDSGYPGNMEKIKFVTHCIPSDSGNDCVLREYLIYKMYNLISPFSFRVRLARVRYIDTGRKDRESIRWGFFIEPEEMLAERLEAVSLDIDHIDYNYTDPESTDIMSMFQYIIGNADYSIQTRQNIKLIKPLNDALSMPIPVPYDFDYSGFVDAYYAIPGDKLGIATVKERYFLGPCRTEERYKEIFSYFFELKDELYSLIESFEYLDKRDKKIALGYLDEFFLQAGQSRFIRNNILSTCRDTL
ncbi:MAG: hypothetical protein V2I37_04325 [Marinilabiliaceae bacterium]|jgi:hypothetical protein|nr:hypothetical protein [Marinilabiliaceae bacterium]